MFTAPRFLVIDDKAEHLKAIVEVFQQIGSPCMGVRYDPAAPPDGKHFRGVRCLIVDLHLVDSGAATDQTKHFALIAGMLEACINRSGGPYLLVIWTQFPQQRQDLADYLDAKLDLTVRPLAVLGLDKTQFINTTTGDPLSPEASAALRQKVEEQIASIPQLRALLDWENDVLSASGATLSALLAQVPNEQRTTAAFGAGLDVVMSRLAKETVGQDNAANDPRGAITSALAPILADRVVNQSVSHESAELWKLAVTNLGKKSPSLSPEEAGQVNRMLHLAVPDSESIRPSDLGAVVEFPADLWKDHAAFRKVYGLKPDQLLGGEFKIDGPDRSKCRPCLVRIGAACDYAQGQSGPLTYLFALEVPVGVPRKKNPKDKDKELKAPQAEWSSPVLTLDVPFELRANCVFPMTLVREQVAGWTVRYRLREQLIAQLVSHFSNHLSRAAIVSIRAGET